MVLLWSSLLGFHGGMQSNLPQACVPPLLPFPTLTLVLIMWLVLANRMLANVTHIGTWKATVQFFFLLYVLKSSYNSHTVKYTYLRLALYPNWLSCQLLRQHPILKFQSWLVFLSGSLLIFMGKRCKVANLPATWETQTQFLTWLRPNTLWLLRRIRATFSLFFSLSPVTLSVK